MKTLLPLLVLAVAAACAGDLDPEADRAAKPDDSEELARLYREDQADRSVPMDSIDWSVVGLRDSLRRARVHDMLDSGLVRTAQDYHHAAMVFQHGSDTTAARMAYEFASKSVRLDSTDEDARWLMAAAWDRYRMRLGEPQWYGTQFVKDGPDEPWRLYEVDTTAVTDDDRARLGVPPLAEARARAIRMNEGNRP